MSSSGLIYAVIVGAWAAYLVPMWLRRQDELNEARPTERFSTAIRLLSGRAGMERRYAKDLQARSPEEEESRGDPDVITDSVDVRAFAVPPEEEREERPAEPRGRSAAAAERARPAVRARLGARAAAKYGARPGARSAGDSDGGSGGSASGRHGGSPGGSAPGGHGGAPGESAAWASDGRAARASDGRAARTPDGRAARNPDGRAARNPAGNSDGGFARKPGASPAGRADGPSQAARRAAAADAAARARRTKVLARRRRTTVMLFVAFTLGTVVAAVGGLAFLWAPAAPAALLSAYIAYLRRQERRRFTYTMDRRRAEDAARQLRERQRRGHGAGAEPEAEEKAPEPDPGLSALAADRRALVEQTDHAEWVDQQRERQHGPGRADSWDPVPVPLPTYVTAPVAPRATGSIDLGAPDTWSSARSSAAQPAGAAAGAGREAGQDASAGADERRADDGEGGADGGRSDARRAASARRSRERGRTPLFDQYDDAAEGDGRPRAANE
ncbi:gephyrin-like molybdotransferase receptor GlpR [Streptomyces sp. NPDC017940]|uniref:divisome protein SepX/GlpR n=1 Tax=Streptomyces sp. NPDC017940 TaxID=3365017 RepID=UPI0037A6B957